VKLLTIPNNHIAVETWIGDTCSAGNVSEWVQKGEVLEVELAPESDAA